MAFHVLIVEDTPDLRSLLYEHLREAFGKDSTYDWPAGWPDATDEQLKIDYLSKTAVTALLKAKRIATVKKRFEAAANSPGVVITDLALSLKEVDDLEDKGGTNVEGVEDPLDQLAATTGFQVLNALAPDTPVIATTFASNPLIIQACWDAGAHAVVRKPATDADMASYYEMWKKRDNPHMRWSEEQQELGRTFGPRIETYLSAMTHEVFKAVQAQSLSQIQSAVPRRVPYWLAVDREQLEAKRIDGTSLILMDVRGFSRLVELGKDEPEALFKMMNKMWAQVQPVLDDCNAEINNFVGDAALIFRGVYDDEDATCHLQDTLRCASEINLLFKRKGEVRTALVDLINSSYRGLRHQDRKIAEKMVSHVTGAKFGVRVVTIEPAADEALYGKVGAPSRWQHTILSRYMNILARHESQLGSWEKAKAFKNRDGESFLVHHNRNEEPDLDGFEFESAKEFLGRTPERIRDVPSGVELFRVMPAVEAELVK